MATRSLGETRPTAEPKADDTMSGWTILGLLLLGAAVLRGLVALADKPPTTGESPRIESASATPNRGSGPILPKPTLLVLPLGKKTLFGITLSQPKPSRDSGSSPGGLDLGDPMVIEARKKDLLRRLEALASDEKKAPDAPVDRSIDKPRIPKKPAVFVPSDYRKSDLIAAIDSLVLVPLKKTVDTVAELADGPARSGRGTMKYVNKTVGFSVDFPIDTSVENELHETIEDNKLDVVLFRKGSEFRVEFLNLAPETVKAADVEKELEKVAEEIAKKGGELVESKAVTIGEGDRKTTGRDFSYKRESGATSKCRMTLIADKFYMASTTTADADAAGRFLKSFVPLK